MKFEADWVEDHVNYSIDLDYEVNYYRRRRTWDSPEENEIQLRIEKIRRCIIKESGKTYIISAPDAIPQKYFDVICRNAEVHYNEA